MSKQVSFDIFAGLLYIASANITLFTPETKKWLISLSSAFFAAVLACLSSQPGDMLLTRSYKDVEKHSIFSLIRTIYKEHGFGGFFLGLQARLAHVVSIITSQLVLYDVLKLFLGLPITGSH